ncbi:GTP-binding protein 1 [Paragonimus kellicotti]|nr:GTP-binding protein 1 [Paragonimus kellicotti]
MFSLTLKSVRQGIVLLAPELQPRACVEFLAEVLILHHPTTIWVGYQAMVHAGPVRQTATILALSGHERLRTGDKDLVRFRFIKYPEYLYAGLRLIFREGKTKAVGTVREVFPLADTISQNPRNRLNKKYTPQTPKPGTQTPAIEHAGSGVLTKRESVASDQTDSLGVITPNPHKLIYSKQRKHYRPRNKELTNKPSTSVSSGSATAASITSAVTPLNSTVDSSTFT